MKNRRALDWNELLEARQAPFSGDVLGQEAILCLECGGFFDSLGSHLRSTHDLTPDAYREHWGYNRGQPLASGRLRDAQRAKREKAWVGSPRAVLQHKINHRPARPQQAAAMREQVRKYQEQRRASPEYVPASAVLELYRRELPLYRIAEVLHCSYHLVKARLIELGLPTGRRPKYPDVTREQVLDLRYQGLTYGQCADILGCSATFVRKVLYEVKPLLSREAALDMLSRGRTVRDIAIYFGVSRVCIERYLYGVVVPVHMKLTNPLRRRSRLDVDAMVALRRQGWSTTAIAQHMGCKPDTVVDRLKDAGEYHPLQNRWIVVPADELVKCRRQGMTVPQLAERFGCSTGTISARLHTLGAVPFVPWRRRLDLTVDAVLQRRREGRTLDSIAEEFHCHPCTVQRRLQEAARQGLPIL